MFDTVRDLFRSIYGVFVLIVFYLGAFFFGLSGNVYYFLGWCGLFLVVVIYKKNRMDKEAAKVMVLGEVQITSDVQKRAIDDYVNLIRRGANRKRARKIREK